MTKALFIRGASCQGGHSKEGSEIADALGVPFPLTMENLEARAIQLGHNTHALWPWLYKMRAGRPTPEMFGE